MPNARFFAKLGLYVDEHFLDTTVCQQISAEMVAADFHSANIISEGEDIYDGTFRQTAVSHVSPETEQLIHQRIKALRPALEAHFVGRKLGKVEKVKFLRYRPGDFFAAHTDEQMARSINISIYLNQQASQPQNHEYAAGELLLYGLIDKPGWQNKSFALRGTTGLLIAYPAELMHEVTAVTQGERHAIVTHVWKQADADSTPL